MTANGENAMATFKAIVIEKTEAGQKTGARRFRRGAI